MLAPIHASASFYALMPAVPAGVVRAPAGLNETTAMKFKFPGCSALVLGLLLVGLSACEAKKSSNPLSPSVAGPIPGVQITAPKLLEPAQGFKLKESQQPIRLLIENASSTGVRPL